MDCFFIVTMIIEPTVSIVPNAFGRRGGWVPGGTRLARTGAERRPWVRIPKYMLSGFNVPNAIGACNSHSHNSNIIELFGTGNKVIYVTFNGFNLL